MEEQPLPVPDLDALKAALQRKSLKASCLVCRENEWSTPEGTNMIVGAVDTNGQIDLSLGVEAIAVVCTNCGFVQLHSTEFLLGT